jgi:leucyl/phenylalanyl-tRNA--protein transferase
MHLTALDPNNPDQPFPPLDKALHEPNGLIAIGGCLSVQRLLNAYKHGIFPWYNPGEPILWWSPNPRLVLFPDQLRVSRSLRKTLRKNLFTFTIDQAFEQVITACAQPREKESGTWITQHIHKAYNALHQLGIAHSAETWLDGELVGGLYGVALGQVFFGESMFQTHTDASKVAFVQLVEQLTSWDYQLIDCQVHTSHLESLGAEEISREQFIQLLKQYCETPVNPSAWR